MKLDTLKEKLIALRQGSSGELKTIARNALGQIEGATKTIAELREKVVDMKKREHGVMFAVDRTYAQTGHSEIMARIKDGVTPYGGRWMKLIKMDGDTVTLYVGDRGGLDYRREEIDQIVFDPNDFPKLNAESHHFVNANQTLTLANAEGARRYHSGKVAHWVGEEQMIKVDHPNFNRTYAAFEEVKS